jgi:hypothetical protein
MPTFSIDANGTDMGCYVASTKTEALDKFAEEAGYSSYQEAVEEVGDHALVIEIDTDALCHAVSEATGHLVFQDSYGNGVARVDDTSYGTWQELAESIGKNCWDFKA